MASASWPAWKAAGIETDARQRVPIVEGHDRRQVDARVVEPRHEGFEPLPAISEREPAEVLPVRHEDVVGPHVDRVLRDRLGRNALAVQALLQAREGLHPAFDHDQQFAVERRRSPAPVRQAVHQVRKAAGNVVAASRVEPLRRPAVALDARDGLDPDAVPLPLGRKVTGRQGGEILRLVDGVGQHGGAERGRIDRVRLRSFAGRIGEEGSIGRLQAVPDLLDVVGRVRPQRRHGGLGQTSRDADPQRPRDQLQQRPAADLVESVEPTRDDAGQGHLSRGGQGLDHRRQRGASAVVRYRGPHQRDRLGEVTDVVIGHLEQHGIGALRRERMDHGRLGVGESQRIGQRREGIAALRIRRGGEIGCHQPDLAVAARFEGEPIEQLREVLHAASGTSSSVSSP